MSFQTTLQDTLLSEINTEGPISFRSFMERALYDPVHGYYASGKVQFGRRGDFLTSPSLTPAFGALIGAYAESVWRAAGEPSSFLFSEQGAGDGALARDFLSYVNRREFGRVLAYEIVEPFPALQRRQENTLGEWGTHVRWRHPSEPPDRCEWGMHFSNELIDAFPVHVVKRQDQTWVELFVEAAGDSLCLVPSEISSPGVKTLLGLFPDVYPEGFQTEILPNLDSWASSALSPFENGCAVVIDYGGPFHERYDPRKGKGTLRAYGAHQRVDNPLEAPGDVDLTAHVDFTGVARAFLQAGLHILYFTDQHRFLTGVLAGLMRASPQIAEGILRLPDVSLLTHPSTFGAAFRVLVAAMGEMPQSPLLAPDPLVRERLGF
jgi:SAM-dependent MidA family methyltransferase